MTYQQLLGTHSGALLNIQEVGHSYRDGKELSYIEYGAMSNHNGDTIFIQLTLKLTNTKWIKGRFLDNLIENEKPISLVVYTELGTKKALVHKF